MAVSIPAQIWTLFSTPRCSSSPITARLPEAAPACCEERACAHTTLPWARHSGSCRPPSACFVTALSTPQSSGTLSKTQYKTTNSPSTFQMNDSKMTGLKRILYLRFPWGLRKKETDGTESAEANLLAIKTSKRSADLLGSSALTAPSVPWLLRKEVSSSPPRRSPFSVEVPMIVSGTVLKNRRRLHGGYLKCGRFSLALTTVDNYACRLVWKGVDTPREEPGDVNWVKMNFILKRNRLQ